MINPRDLRMVYEMTRILRKPTYGIVTGYHELPYVCLGEATEPGHRTTRVKGRVHVSPRFIVRPRHLEPSYAEIFGDEYLDAALQGRIFGFMGFKGRPVECSSEHLEVEHLPDGMDAAVSRVLDDLERYEDITTGVILTPNPDLFPVSVEAFIASILEDEFSL